MEDSNKKKLFLSIIAITILLIIVIGATYAYFAVGTANNFGTKTISAEAADIGDITLSTPVTSLHVAVSASDMMESNSGYLYYATPTNGINYVKVQSMGGLTDNMQSILANSHNVVHAVLENDESNTNYKCIFNMNLSATGTMVNSFDYNWDGNLIIYNKTEFMKAVSQNDMQRAFNTLVYLGAPQSVSMPIEINLNGSSGTTVDLAAVMFIENENYEQSHLEGKSMTITVTNSNLNCTATGADTGVIAANTVLEGKSGVSTKLLGGLYRYQGSSPNNYICFGTDNTSTCTNTPDTYMYRILGVTSGDSLKLIKDTSIGNMEWNQVYNTDITWPNSDLYSAINGSSFLSNTTYVPNSTWGGLISTTNWKYGDMKFTSLSGDVLYAYENAWNTTTSAKIGLMYQHDYVYGNEWIGYRNRPWMISRYGLSYQNGNYTAWHADSSGSGWWNSVVEYCVVRPVFYLTSGVTLTGTGTSADPYIISVS